MKYTTKAIAYFTVKGEEYQFDISDLAIGQILVEETAKNGQEDTHYQGEFFLNDEGKWQAEYETNNYDHDPKAIARFLTNNPYYTPIFDDELDGMITQDDLTPEDFFRAIEITRDESTTLHGDDYEPTLADLISKQ